MIRIFIVVIILLNSCALNSKDNLYQSVDFSNFFDLSINEYKKKLENYNKSKNYPNIDK